MTTDTVGGVWNQALELASALSGDGVEIALATCGDPPAEDQREDARAVPGLRLHESRFSPEWMEDRWSEVDRAGTWLLELEAEISPDVVHLNGFSHGALPWRRPVLVTGHSCLFSWWKAVHGCAPPDRDEYRRRTRTGLRSADHVVAPTAAMLRALERHYGPLPPSSVVANGRDPARFPPGPPEDLVLTAGRLWDEGKNVAALDRVAPELPWPVYAAGSREHPEGGHVRPAHLRCLGRLSEAELAGWFARASIYALPARYEPFGLTALEAALAGCALVLGDIESLRETWEGVASFVPPDDPAALRQALVTLIADPDRRAAAARRARGRALRYGRRRMAEGYLERYRQLVAVGRREAACAS